MQDEIEALAEWSSWVPFAEAVKVAPLLPGVYMAREGVEGPVVYVGMAGERAGSGRPQGLRGRLLVYARGKALTSGLGEAVADRAFADASWLRARLAEVEQGQPMRAVEWGRSALARADLHIRWAVAADKAEAVLLEQAVGRLIAIDQLWNRSAFRQAPAGDSATT